MNLAIYFYPLLAFGIALLVHYLVITMSHKSGLFLDEQEKIQKAHLTPTPRIGGLGIFLAALFIVKEQSLGIYIILASIPAFLSGFIEDYTEKASPAMRLIIMSLAPLMAIMLIPGNIFQWGPLSMSWFVGGGITILFLLASINGVNFMDGQNGLASGSAGITFAAIAMLAFIYKDVALFYISLTLIAAILGFLIFNYPYARIFLGDSGAYLSGFLMALLAVLFLQRNMAVAPLTVIVLLIYPLWEVVFSTIRKVLFDRISPLQSDRNHLHQLIYRHYGRGKGYIPALILLPAQAVVSLLACLFSDHNGLLLLLASLFVALYCGVYFYERTFAARSESTRITLK